MATEVVRGGRKWSQVVLSCLTLLTTPLTLSAACRGARVCAGVMSSKSDVLKAKLSKLPSSKINAACEALACLKLSSQTRWLVCE